MAKIDDKVTCQYCGKDYSKAGIANHEKACPKNPDNIVEEEKVLEVKEEIQVITEPVAKKEKLVRIKMKDSIECYIGDKYYRLKKGVEYDVPEEVKARLKQADLLEAI